MFFAFTDIQTQFVNHYFGLVQASALNNSIDSFVPIGVGQKGQIRIRGFEIIFIEENLQQAGA